MKYCLCDIAFMQVFKRPHKHLHFPFDLVSRTLNSWTSPSVHLHSCPLLITSYCYLYIQMIQSTLSLIIQSYAAELSENQISLSSQPGGAHEYFFLTLATTERLSCYSAVIWLRKYSNWIRDDVWCLHLFFYVMEFFYLILKVFF